MIRIQAITGILFLLLVIPSLGQTYVSAWRYKLELHQSQDGVLNIFYSKQLKSSFLQEVYGPDHAETINLIQWMNDKGSTHSAILMMPGYNNDTGNSYQRTMNYFQYLNQKIPTPITIPDYSIKKRFPDINQNQYFPLPDG